MRVLNIAAGNLQGGAESLLCTLAQYSREVADFRPEFALCYEGWLARELASSGAVAHSLAPARLSRPWTVWRARRRLRALLARGGYEVAICHGGWSHVLFAQVVQRAGLPLVFWPHDVPRGRGWLERLASRYVPDVVMANSRFTAVAVSHLFGKTPAWVVHPPVPPPTPGQAPPWRLQKREALRLGEGKRVILCVARLHPLKGHPVLLQALGRLRELASWECWIAGAAQPVAEAVYLESLRRTAARLGIAERVHFLGQRDDVPGLMAAADIYCQANVRPESFGLAFVEALYAGLPVVTSALGGALEIVDDRCGVLVPPGDADALARVLRRLLVDKELCARLAEAGPQRAHSLCSPSVQVPLLKKRLEMAVLKGQPACPS